MVYSLHKGDQMRKRIIERGHHKVPETEHHWLNLENMVQAEITSEDAAHPIESALVSGSGSGWRAAESGEQTLRLLFDEPQGVELIHLAFHEDCVNHDIMHGGTTC